MTGSLAHGTDNMTRYCASDYTYCVFFSVYKYVLSDELKLYSRQNSDNVCFIVMVLESGFLCCKLRMRHCNGSHLSTAQRL
jgi:hypothetical protein